MWCRVVCQRWFSIQSLKVPWAFVWGACLASEGRVWRLEELLWRPWTFTILLLPSLLRSKKRWCVDSCFSPWFERTSGLSSNRPLFVNGLVCYRDVIECALHLPTLCCAYWDVNCAPVVCCLFVCLFLFIAAVSVVSICEVLRVKVWFRVCTLTLDVCVCVTKRHRCKYFV